MRAVIHQSPDFPCAGLFPVAGRPLIARQLQWLRMIGCEAIAVEIGPSAESAEIARWLTEEDAIGAGVSLVRTERCLSPREIARRAGFEGRAPLLVVPADVLAGGRVEAPCDADGARGTAIGSPPEALAGRLSGGTLHVIGARSAASRWAARPGWAVRVRSFADAMALSAAALDGRLSSRPSDPSWGIQVHAAEISPGIWVSRGALIEPGAEIIAPALIGSGAIVCAGARVGPRVTLGERSVVEADTVIRDALVFAGTIVGEGLTLAHVVVDPNGLRNPETGALREVRDPLVLTGRDRVFSTGHLTRALSRWVFFILSPAAALLRLFAICSGHVLRRRSIALLQPQRDDKRARATSLIATRAPAESPGPPCGDRASPG
jgi:hypothetical protein